MFKRALLLTIAFTAGFSISGQGQSRFFFGRINSIIDAFARITATQAQVQSQSRTFLGQMSAILAAGGQGFGGTKGRLLNTTENGRKTYECKRPLDGFKTMLTENGGAAEFYAASTSYTAAHTNVQYLMNEIVREQDGMPGYLNHDNAAENFTIASYEDEAITMLTKKGSAVRLFIYKLRNQAGYILVAK